jgi:hypothetical protein
MFGKESSSRRQSPQCHGLSCARAYGRKTADSYVGAGNEARNTILRFGSGISPDRILLGNAVHGNHMSEKSPLMTCAVGGYPRAFEEINPV